MRKILLLVVLSITVNVYSQKLNQKIFTDIYSFPSSDTTLQFFYLYKIPVNSLIFSKSNDLYSAAVQINIELNDSNSNFIQRYFKDRNVSFNEFSLTLDPNIYIEGVVSFPAENKTLVINSRVYNANSQKEIFSKEQVIQKVNEEDAEFLTPLILNDKMIACNEDDYRVVPNFGGFIPFDNSSYDFLIPCTDTAIEKLYVKVISRRDTVFSGPIERYNLQGLNLSECDNRIIISTDFSSQPISSFYLTQMSQKLREGQIEIVVSKSDDFIKKRTFRSIVKWLQKPISLSDPESAIKLLRFVITDDSIKKILKSSDNYDSLLHKYWKNIDPSPTTEYNELMAEYYERIDYSIKNFTTISSSSGIETDRAKIYILYGKPSLVDRGSNGDGKVSEIWFYSKLNKKFIFVDEKGTGEFNLKSNL